METVVHLRRARDLMDIGYAEPLDLDAMAAEAGFSRYHFAREFRAAFGETPGGYLSRRRVERAKDMLASANLTVTEICMLVGFSSLGSFCNRFRDLVGLSPGAYRDLWAARGGARVPGCYLFMRGVADHAGTAPGGTAPGGTVGFPQSGRSQRTPDGTTVVT
jgi:AraC-like DNA-binding protein